MAQKIQATIQGRLRLRQGRPCPGRQSLSQVFRTSEACSLREVLLVEVEATAKAVDLTMEEIAAIQTSRSFAVA